MVKTRAAGLLLSAVFFAGTTVFGCGMFSDFAIPETVAVKSNARYVGALGQKYYDLSEKLGDDFASDLSNNIGGDVYKYIPNPSDQTLSYLVHKKLYDVPLDASKFIDSVKLDNKIADGLKFEKSIVLGKLEETASAVVPKSDATGLWPFALDVSLPFALDDTIKSATIGEGSIVIQVAGSGAALSIDSLTINGLKKGGVNVFDDSDFEPGPGTGSYILNKRLDLAGADFDVNAIKTSKKIDLSATISVTSGSIDQAAPLSCLISVKKISSAVADFSGVCSFKMDDATENKTQLPKEMVTYVTDINFGQADGGSYYKSDENGTRTTTKSQGKGIKLATVNSFPPGNDIKFDVKSTVFGIDSKNDGIYINETLEAGGAIIKARGNESEVEERFANYSDLNLGNTLIYGTSSNPAYIDFSVTLSDSQTFTNLEMGKTYKVSVSDSEFIFDWDKVEMSLDVVQDVSDTSDLSDFTIDSMLSEVDGEIGNLVKNCEFKSVPVFFLVQKPEGDLASSIGNISMSGEVSLAYKDKDDAPQTKSITDPAGSSVPLDFCKPVAWPDQGQVFTKAFDKDNPDDCSLYYDFAEVLNERPKELKVNYTMGLADGASCSFYKANFDKLSKDAATSIAVEMAAVLNFVLNVSKDTELDIYKIAKMEDMEGKKDLMYRDSLSDTERCAKYTGAVSYLRLNYNFINSAVDGLKAKVVVDDRHQGEAAASEYSGIFRTIDVTGNDASDDVIDFTSDEIKAALSHFFKPKMTLTVQKGQLCVRRSAIESPSSLGISPSVILQLNENSPVVITDIVKK